MAEFPGFEKFGIETTSVDHHYIPVFFIKGFFKASTKLYVYDKEKDRIYNRAMAPKGILYGPYLNSIDLDGKLFPIIENLYSKGPDQSLPPFIRALQDSVNDKVEMTDQRISLLIYFISCLTWRVPANKIILNIMIDYYSSIFPEMYQSVANLKLSKEDFYKFCRAGTVATIYKKFPKPSGKISVNLIDFHTNTFCLSDNPVLWHKFPTNIEEFSKAVIFPISTSKCFLITDQPDYVFAPFDVRLTSFVMMHNAKQYVVSHDKKFLELLVSEYKNYRSIGPHQRGIIDGLFDRINRRVPPYEPQS